jgi:hypothetical protein
MSKVTYSTRNNDGDVQHHKENIQEAFASFLSLNGYRLDILLSDQKILHIHRDDFSKETLPESKKNHPAFSSFYTADARLVYYDSSTELETSSFDNVINVKFGEHFHD